jgi:cytochrome c oxidase assembly factor CtaG
MLRRSVFVAVAAMLAAPAFAVAQTHADRIAQATAIRHNWTSAWNASFLEFTFITIAMVLYAIRARRLGPRLPRWRAACFFAGLVVLGLAGASPIDPIGEHGVFWVHMLQHMMIGDLAALLLVLGITGPILQPALQFRFVQRLRKLTHPMVACLIWAGLLILWHTPVLYQAALDNSFIHGIEHASFLMGGMLMWAPVLETLPAPEWFGTGAKLGYILGIRMIDAVIANAFWWAGTPFYARYEDTAPLWGLTALEDQGYAGTVMMTWTGTVTLILAGILFFRMAREGELRQQLIERGIDPVAVRRAVRYGRGEILAARHGVSLGDRPPPSTTV